MEGIKCTECGELIEPRTQYIAAVRWIDTPQVVNWGEAVKSHLDFFWACEHKPAPDAEVRLGSKQCLERFCEKHPEYIEAVVELMAAYDEHCTHAETGEAHDNHTGGTEIGRSATGSSQDN